MNVTSKGRYALRIMIDLAQHREDGFISLKTVSERTELSMKYLEMIVGNLKKPSLCRARAAKRADISSSRIRRTTQSARYCAAWRIILHPLHA